MNLCQFVPNSKRTRRIHGWLFCAFALGTLAFANGKAGYAATTVARAPKTTKQRRKQIRRILHRTAKRLEDRLDAARIPFTGPTCGVRYHTLGAIKEALSSDVTALKLAAHPAYFRSWSPGSRKAIRERAGKGVIEPWLHQWGHGLLPRPLYDALAQLGMLHSSLVKGQEPSSAALRQLARLCGEVVVYDKPPAREPSDQPKHYKPAEDPATTRPRQVLQEGYGPHNTGTLMRAYITAHPEEFN